MFETLKASRQILGLNARNLNFIRAYNLMKAKRLADNKLLTKKFLKTAGVPVPDLIATIKTKEKLENFDWSKLPDSFVLKPNAGFGGEGIIAVYKKKKRPECWVKTDGSFITNDDIKTHILNIFDGTFSRLYLPDTAFFEEKIECSKTLKPYAYCGIPDIRVIVFNMVPVMAMLRLPTENSGGKANLHQGGIGVGIDIASGITTNAILDDKIIEYLPNTDLKLSGIKIPFWKEILVLAIKAQGASGLGFLGADIAIDKNKGPVFLELNARPGLSIQIANMEGLLGRMRRVEGLKIKNIERGVNVGMNLFGGEVEGEIENISGRKVIGPIQKIKLIGKNNQEIEILAKIDSGAESSSIDAVLAKKLGYGDLIKFFNKIEKPAHFQRKDTLKIERKLKEKYLAQNKDLADITTVYSSHGYSIRPKIRLKFVMAGVEVIAKTSITNRSGLDYKIIIGRNSLARFLIDASKKVYG